MLIIVDKKIPVKAKNCLRQHGDLLELETEEITYPAISGHPDIFFCQTPGGLVIAPNLPAQYFEILAKHHIQYLRGEKPVGSNYPFTARYNAVATQKFFIHNTNLTDASLKKVCDHLAHIHVGQGYTRCNLLPLGQDLFITSDRGIEQTLLKNNIRCLYLPSGDIRLNGFTKGFIGGACGMRGNEVFVCGKLSYHSWGDQFLEIASSEGFAVNELHDAEAQDVGSIMFVE